MWSSSADGKRGSGVIAAAVISLMAAVGSRAEDRARIGNGAEVEIERVRVGESSPGRIWREAEAYAAARTDCEVLVGRGDSMLPLFRDRTVIVVRRTPLGELRAGMTVVFLGDQGRPVAHVLVARSAGGWIAKGLANAEVDRTRVSRRNYVGQVVRAYVPDSGAPGAHAGPVHGHGAASAAGAGQ